jgi:diadenosine tetraphosphate (Ap4A) HIT family hydrolase
VVLVDDARYPGFCRVILRRHAAEMSDLAGPEREALMKVVFAVEEALRHTMRPDKVNLASLGNAVPHVHWHVIPRFRDDAHFPTPIWGEPRQEGVVAAARLASAARLPEAVRARLERLRP